MSASLRGRVQARTQTGARLRQCGQIAPVALFGMLIAGAALVMMFNTGQKITARSQVTNAADAAAYSGAVWTARHLNFMAYTNRAMIANHAAVGHLVSYVSWVRYIDDSIGYIDRITQFIPYVGQYVDLVEQLVQQVRQLTEREAALFVPAIDGWNRTFRAAQAEAQASLALDHLNELMRRTAQAWDPDIRINDSEALAAMPAALRGAIELQLMQQVVNVPTFVQRYRAGSDNDAINQLIAASVNANDDERRWITGERGWRENLVLAQIRKQGSTNARQTDAGAEWRATDQLQHRTRSLFGWGSWRRIGQRPSSATATEFHADYSGVPAYYNVAGTPADRRLHITALATKPQRKVATHAAMGMDSSTQPIAVAAMARVEFLRPTGSAFASLGRGRHEYANLFNPFWSARLVAIDSGIAP